MATIKSYSDLQQSKKLAEILPLESADMYIDCTNPYYIHTELKHIEHFDSEHYPCWSLAALLEQLPYELCDDNGNSTYLSLNKDDNEYQLIYSDRYGYFDDIETEPYGDFVDACVEMILKLKENNLL